MRDLALHALDAAKALQAIATDDRQPGVVYLVPRGRPGPVRTVKLPQRSFVVHFANAFDVDAMVLDHAGGQHGVQSAGNEGYGLAHSRHRMLEVSSVAGRLLMIAKARV